MVKETLNDEGFKGLNTNGLYLVALPSQLSALLLMPHTDIDSRLAPSYATSPCEP